MKMSLLQTPCFGLKPTGQSITHLLPDLCLPGGHTIGNGGHLSGVLIQLFLPKPGPLHGESTPTTHTPRFGSSFFLSSVGGGEGFVCCSDGGFTLLSPVDGLPLLSPL